MTEAIDLRLGRWQDELRDVECDLLLVDGPYGQRTHRGHDAGVDRSTRAGQAKKKHAIARRRKLAYDFWTPEDVWEFVERWHPRTRGWFCAMSCSDLFPHWRAALASVGRTTFAPVPIILRGMSVRMSGDGPSNWALYLNVARPKSLSRWGTLPGSYEGPPVDPGQDAFARSKAAVAGAKPEWLMRAIVGHYSRRGDVVCDPMAGGGTTLVAAASMLRQAVGAEQDLATYNYAAERIREGVQVELEGVVEDEPREQMELCL